VGTDPPAYIKPILLKLFEVLELVVALTGTGLGSEEILTTRQRQGSKMVKFAQAEFEIYLLL
jgi:hypothetical protein